MWFFVIVFALTFGGVGGVNYTGLSRGYNAGKVEGGIMLTGNNNNYGHILRTRRILYMPSCLIVEMMMRLYSQVSTISPGDNPHVVVPDLLVLLRRLSRNMRATIEAYGESRIKFFIGDWRDDRLRARRVLFNILSRLGHVSERLGTVERRMLLDGVERMNREWNDLNMVMEKRCQERACHQKCDTCRFFRSDSPNSWQRVMATTLLSLNDSVVYDDPSAILILLCYKRVKTQLLKEIERVKADTGRIGDFVGARIECMSDEELPLTCPTCSHMAEEDRRTTVVRKKDAPEPTLPSQTRSIGKSAETGQRRISLARVTDSPVSNTRRYGLPVATSVIQCKR